MIAYTPGCHMPLQAQIKMRIIERVHKKNKKSKHEVSKRNGSISK